MLTKVNRKPNTTRRLVLAALRAELRRVAVDATLAERFGMNTPEGRRALKLRRQLQAAIDEVEKEKP